MLKESRLSLPQAKPRRKHRWPLRPMAKCNKEQTKKSPVFKCHLLAFPRIRCERFVVGAARTVQQHMTVQVATAHI